MTTSWKIRSGFLVLIITLALVATMALIGAQSVTADNGTVAPEIEGTWLATVTIPGGPPPFPSLVTYARGGALTVTDSSVSPALGNVYQGTWARTGAKAFAFTFLGLQYDANGVLANYIRARETLRLEPGGNAYNGTTIIEVLDLDQNVIATDSSTTHGTRVAAAHAFDGAK
jgi:hypothetical protein